MATAIDVKDALAAQALPGKKELLQRFFKTGPGEYGHGDVFIGVMVPEQRAVAKRFSDLSLAQIKRLLDSPVHEHRLTGLLIIVGRYGAIDDEDDAERRAVFEFYLMNAARINNWDLVDVTAPNIVGDFLLRDRDERGTLYRLARSNVLWERRIAIVSTLAFIRAREFDDTLRIAELLLDDKHDLMHKATGWMLREVGKKDERTLTKFLDVHAARMPRTMLRYSIERLSPVQKKRYMRR